MKRGKTVLTTGQVAKICNVAPRTVSKWFDQGHLRGYRIPGSKDRRIPLDQLVQFMRANSIPLEGLDVGEHSILLVEGDSAFGQTLSDALNRDNGYEANLATSAFEAGMVVQKIKPSVMVVDLDMPDVDAVKFARFIRAEPELKDMKLIAIREGLSQAEGQNLLQCGFDAYLTKPFEKRALIELMNH